MPLASSRQRCLKVPLASLKKNSQDIISYLSSLQHYLFQKKDELRYSSSRDAFFPLEERNVGAFLLDAEKTRWRA